MKKIILSVLFALSVNTILAQSVFDKFDDQEGITAVVVNKKMFSLLSKMEVKDKESEQYVSLIRKLENLKVYVTQSSKKASDMKLVSDNYIKSAMLEELIKINQELSPIKILHTNSSNEFESKKDMWLSEQLASEIPVIFTEDSEGNSITSILLPCLDKKQLNVQRCGNKLQLSIGCLRRTYPLPSLFNELSPCGARLVERRLEVRFR